MTSDDIYAKTLQLLESNSYFGMKSTQVKLLKQVIASHLGILFATVEGHNWHCKFMKKPHCHGDVHSLLYSSGLLKEWYVCIFLFDWFLFLLKYLSHYTLWNHLF
uniref:Uncharacterized protein n=1 Tax=Lactuca sativa TaxID=4236 RepID=A0A9R1V2R8_LACSA|nr:hypothetical protein LSAT_V11C600315400 [Lactuca sativa]